LIYFRTKEVSVLMSPSILLTFLVIKSLRSSTSSLRYEKIYEITDEEALEIMGQRLSLEGKLLAIKLEYHQKYLDIMAPTKVFKLYEAEDLFRKHLMERFRHRDGERHPEGEGRRAPEGEGRKAPYREKAEPR